MMADDSCSCATVIQALRSLTSMMLARIENCAEGKGERCTGLSQDLLKIMN